MVETPWYTGTAVYTWSTAVYTPWYTPMDLHVLNLVLRVHSTTVGSSQYHGMQVAALLLVVDTVTVKLSGTKLWTFLPL